MKALQKEFSLCYCRISLRYHQWAMKEINKLHEDVPHLVRKIHGLVEERKRLLK